MTGEHANHRKRMRERLRRSGLEQMAPHEALEYLLYHAIPQGDVNPLAHRLIERFGSLRAVLNAPEEELTLVRGVGGHTAGFLRAVGELASAYYDVKQQPRSPVATLEEAVGGQILAEELPGRRMLETLFFDRDGYLLARERRDWAEPFGYLRPLVACALERRASAAVFLLLSGEEGYAMSEQTWAEMRQIARSFVALEIRVLDVLVRSPGNTVSCRDRGLLTEEITSPVVYSAAETDEEWNQWKEWDDEEGSD